MMKDSFDKANFIIENNEIYDIEIIMKCYFKAYEEISDIDYFITADRLLDEIMIREEENNG
ncbi:hypothetical protein LI034_09635 [Clostridium perfringens]|nr:hypothetical protein [Clostridium perfringens]MCC2765704.1 hypothetical protein [Clostridium perfringens]MCG4543056.1 hypothetical protein [Clostridium perfringens]MCG4546309.1 hypothetical protein [Clostridium perfringens]MCG4553820.1 hypothetical protein [Clostridium perfringens]MCG4557267.1 hypothetical protein [Clostridium perfringens]